MSSIPLLVCDPAGEVALAGVPTKEIFANGLVDGDAACKLGDGDDELKADGCDALGEARLPSSLKLDNV
jgi:hypothetical protein